MFIVATAIALPCYRWMEGRWPIMPMVGGFFVLVFGGLTLWLQDETFIKLKPTIVNCLFGVILGGGLLFLQRPLLKPIFGAAKARTIARSTAATVSQCWSRERAGFASGPQARTMSSTNSSLKCSGAPTWVWQSTIKASSSLGIRNTE